MNKVEIEKIIIKVGDKELSLSVDEAKELKTILNELFAEKEIVYSPIIIEKFRRYVYPHWEITCGESMGSDKYGSRTILLSSLT